MPSWIELYDGYQFNLDNLASVSVVGNALRLTSKDGSVKDWPANDSGYAAYLQGKIKAVMQTPANYTLINQAYLTSISPTSITFASSTITVKGFGFKASTVGLIYFEDTLGGQDSNGPSMTCTFVDSNTLTAVKNNDGDAQYDVSMIAYYQDSGAVKSNSLPCSSPSTGIITMT